MTNEELVEKIRFGQDKKQNMEQLWNQNTGMVAYIAWRYRERAELDDLMQEGYLGLQEAVWRYDQSKGVPFINYATYWIKQGMVRYIKGNNTVRVPEYMMHNVSEYDRLCREFAQEHGRKPTDAEISYFIGLNEKDIESVKRCSKILKCRSIDAPIGEDEGNTLYDILPSSDSDMDEKDVVLDKVNNEQLAEVLWGMVEELPGQQSEVLKMRFKDNMKLREIGAVRGFSIDRARQIENKGLRTLRNPKRSRILREFLHDSWIYSRGLSGNGVGAFNISWTSSTERIAMRMIEKEEEIETVMHEPRAKQEGI